MNEQDSFDESSLIENDEIRLLKSDWNSWKLNIEIKWREKMAMKKLQLSQKYQEEFQLLILSRINELQALEDDITNLELKFKKSLNTLQKSQTSLSNDQQIYKLKLEEKLKEIEILNDKIDTDMQSRILSETNRCQYIQEEIQVKRLVTIKQLDDKLHDLDKELSSFLESINNKDEIQLKRDVNQLRIENDKIQNQLNHELNIKIDLECNKRDKMLRLEKLRDLLNMHQERNSKLLIEDEQKLQLEFLAKEER